MAVDADDRLSNYQTSSPFRDYHIEAKQFTTDKKKLEEIAHKEAAKLGVQLGEWFKINKLQAISYEDHLYTRTSHYSYEIIDTPQPADDPLNWQDTKSYKDRLKIARKKIVILGLKITIRSPFQMEVLLT